MFYTKHTRGTKVPSQFVMTDRSRLSYVKEIFTFAPRINWDGDRHTIHNGTEGASRFERQ